MRTSVPSILWVLHSRSTTLRPGNASALVNSRVSRTPVEAGKGLVRPAHARRPDRVQAVAVRHTSLRAHVLDCGSWAKRGLGHRVFPAFRGSFVRGQRKKAVQEGGQK